jgi:hypothetical protein
METFAHRSNDIPYLYLLYWQRYVRRFEIDVQITKDGVIIVYHDDCSKYNHQEAEALHKRPVFTLVEFLRCTPDEITLNIEIKRYNDIDYSDEVIKICRKHKGFKNIVYSSFDIDVVKNLKNKGLPHWLLLKSIPEPTIFTEFKDICVNINILDEISKSLSADVNLSVYGLHENDIVKYWSAAKYSRVVNWIVEYYDTLKYRSKSIA